jgi:hypothetical protein
MEIEEIKDTLQDQNNFINRVNQLKTKLSFEISKTRLTKILKDLDFNYNCKSKVVFLS